RDGPPASERHPLSLHDALPISIFEGNRDTVGVVDCVIRKAYRMDGVKRVEIPIPENMVDRINQHRAALCENVAELSEELMERYLDRKSTRLNSSHVSISYAVFC